VIEVTISSKAVERDLMESLLIGHTSSATDQPISDATDELEGVGGMESRHVARPPTSRADLVSPMHTENAVCVNER